MIKAVTMTTMTMIMLPLEMASSLVGSGPELADAAFQPESGGAIVIIVIVAVINILQSSLEEKHNAFMCTRRRFMCTRRRFKYMKMNLRLVHMNQRLVHMNALCFSSIIVIVFVIAIVIIIIVVVITILIMITDH